MRFIYNFVSWLIMSSAETPWKFTGACHESKHDPGCSFWSLECILRMEACCILASLMQEIWAKWCIWTQFPFEVEFGRGIWTLLKAKNISKYHWLDLTRLIFFSRGSAFFLTLHGINSHFYPTSRYLNEFFICKNNLKVTFYILMNIILILLSTKGDARTSLFMGSFIIQKYFHVGFRVCWSPMITAYYLTKAKGTTMWSTMHKSRGR